MIKSNISLTHFILKVIQTQLVELISIIEKYDRDSEVFDIELLTLELYYLQLILNRYVNIGELRNFGLTISQLEIRYTRIENERTEVGRLRIVSHE